MHSVIHTAGGSDSHNGDYVKQVELKSISNHNSKRPVENWISDSVFLQSRYLL